MCNSLAAAPAAFTFDSPTPTQRHGRLKTTARQGGIRRRRRRRRQFQRHNTENTRTHHTPEVRQGMSTTSVADEVTVSGNNQVMEVTDREQKMLTTMETTTTTTTITTTCPACLYKQQVALAEGHNGVLVVDDDDNEDDDCVLCHFVHLDLKQQQQQQPTKDDRRAAAAVARNSTVVNKQAGRGGMEDLVIRLHHHPSSPQPPTSFLPMQTTTTTTSVATNTVHRMLDTDNIATTKPRLSSSRSSGVGSMGTTSSVDDDDDDDDEDEDEEEEEEEVRIPSPPPPPCSNVHAPVATTTAAAAAAAAASVIRYCEQHLPPSVIISDHSRQESDNGQDDGDENALEEMEFLAEKSGSTSTDVRRDSLTSIGSSISSLSSLGEEDDGCSLTLDSEDTAGGTTATTTRNGLVVGTPFSTQLQVFVRQGHDTMKPQSERMCGPCSTVLTSAWRKVRSLVTSPFMQTYKRQKYPWIQLAGHQGNFKSGQHPGTILKRLNGNEDECFRRLMLDALRSFAPVFYSVQTLGEGEMYLELEDLLAHFQNPSIMDVKMGTRTYLEEELIKAGEKPKLRKDMYDKMVAIDPDEPSGEERSLRAVTKPRYMVWRETISSTSTLGFRIDGIRVTEPPASDGNVPIKPIKDFKRTKTEESVCAAIRQFTANNAKCVTKYVERLRTIRKTIEHSEFFRTHEVIGSSLLFVHDNDHADIWLIDFAKTYPLPAGVSINHRDAWALGNHEDGYLTGLDNLIRIFSETILVEQAPGPDSRR